MSALGHKRTFAVQKGMSALLPKADMCGALAHVCFVTKANIPALTNHLVHYGDQARRGCPSVVQTCPLLSRGHRSDGERTLMSIYA